MFVFNRDYTIDLANRTATVSVNNTSPGKIWFKNIAVEEPPPPGLEGCTPGFWKQSQHFAFWTGYTQGQTWG